MVTSTPAMQELLVIDYKNHTGDIDDMERSREYYSWFERNGGQYDEGNMQGGLKQPTEAAQRQAMIADNDTSAHVGRTISATIGEVPDADSGKVGAYTRSFLDRIREQFGADFVVSGMTQSDKRSRIRSMFSEVFAGFVPDGLELDRMLSYIETGEEEGLETSISNFQRGHLERYVNADTQESFGVYKNSQVQSIPPMMRLEMAESLGGREATPEYIAEYGQKHGLQIVRDNKGNFIVSVDKTKGTADGQLFYFPSREGEDYTALRVGDHFAEAKEGFDNWRSDTAGNIVPELQDKFEALGELMDLAGSGNQDGEGGRMHDLLRGRGTLAGMTQEKTNAFMDLIEDPHTMGINQARLAIVVDLINRGVDPNSDEWKPAAIGKAARGWTRSSNGEVNILFDEGKQLGYEVVDWLSLHQSGGAGGYTRATFQTQRETTHAHMDLRFGFK